MTTTHPQLATTAYAPTVDSPERDETSLAHPARRLERFAGGAALASGAITIAFWLVHPRAADPQAARTEAFFDAVASERFAAINAAFVALILFSLFALVALHQRVLRDRPRWHPWPAFLLAYAGSALFVPLGAFQAGVAPILAGDGAHRALLAADGPLFAGPFTMFIAAGGLAFAIGYVWLGVHAARGRLPLVPRWAGLAFVLSSPVLGFSALMPFEARLIGSTIWGVALFAVGVGLLRGSSERNETGGAS